MSSILTNGPYGSPSWTRTNDPAVNSRMLYQLSYWGIFNVRQRPTFPGGRPPSIIGTLELNFRVRYGNGWNLHVIVTGLFFDMFSPLSFFYTYSRIFRALHIFLNCISRVLPPQDTLFCILFLSPLFAPSKLNNTLHKFSSPDSLLLTHFSRRFLCSLTKSLVKRSVY